MIHPLEKARKLVAIPVSPELVGAMLTNGEHQAYRIEGGIPADAVFVRAVPIEHFQLALWYVHPDFPAVPDGREVPRVEPRATTLAKRAKKAPALEVAGIEESA